MTLEDVYYVSQIVAAAAILASLLYAGLQFRSFAKQAREARLASYTSDFRQFRLAIIADREVVRIFRDGLEGATPLDPIDQWRFGAMMQNVTSNMYLMLEFSDVAPTELTSEGWDWTVIQPGYRSWWSNAKTLYTDRLRRLVEQAHEKADAAKLSSQLKGIDA